MELISIAEGLPVPGRDSPIDSVDDFFRVRLVCTLLHTFGPCFSKGSQKRKMDHFLTIFQVSSDVSPHRPGLTTSALRAMQERDADGCGVHAQ